MKITQHTDYGLRVLLYLAAHPGQRVPTHRIAAAHRISLNHLHKVVGDLGALDLVELRRGPGGGVLLAKDPQEITVGSVVRALEVGSPLVECFDPVQDQCVITPACGLRNLLGTALEAFLQELDAVTLGQLVTPARASKLRGLLAGGKGKRGPA